MYLLLVYLSKFSVIRKKSIISIIFLEDQLIMVCADILIAGAQTTSNTLDFAFLMMILHERVQEKVQQELDKIFSKSTPIEYNNRIRYVTLFFLGI